MKKLLLLAIIILAAGRSYAENRAILPSHNYQIALELVADLEKLCKTKNISTFIDYIEIDNNKTPTDVYNKAYELVDKLQLIINKHDAALASKISIPSKKQGRKIPLYVHEVLHIARDQVQLLAYGEHQGKPDLDTVGPLKTSSDVYHQVLRAIALTEKLL